MLPDAPDATEFAQRFGALLREHRGDRRQIPVAHAAGVSNTTYSDYERGLSLPSLRVALQLLHILDIDPAEVLALLRPEPNGGDKGVAA